MFLYTLRRLIYNIPVYLGVILIVMLILRTNDPIYSHLGKNASQEDYDAFAARVGLDKPFVVQYFQFLGRLVRLDFSEESWDQPGVTVGQTLRRAVWPSLAITVPSEVFVTFLSVAFGLFSSFRRGRPADRILVFLCVLGMSISALVYIIFGQYWGAYLIYQRTGKEIFAIDGYEPGISKWAHYCLLPVLINVVVAMGYDTRFYRAVMVEESTRDYLTTARAKGASESKIMFVHMLKNAMIPIVTQISISLPFLITGSIVLEMYFSIPGMGRELILAVTANDFPVVQTFTAIFAAFYILTNVLTDVVYALVDPRVRLS